MKKTPKMLEIEKKIGEPIDVYLRREYVDERASTYEIGKNLGISRKTAYRWLKEDGIEIRDLSKINLPDGFTKPLKKELRRMYVDKRMSTTDIAKKLGVSHTTIRKWLGNYSIKKRDSSEARLAEGISMPSKEKLEQLYVNEKKSAERIAKELGVCYTTVFNWLKRHDIPTRPSSQKNFEKPREDQLRRWYVDEGRSIYKIAEQFNISPTSVFQWLRRFNITRKDHDKPFTKMSNDELISYISGKYESRTLNEFRKSGLYNEARKRKLIDILVRDGIIVREKRQNWFFSNMSNDDLIAYFQVNHYSKSITEVQKQDKGAYNQAYKNDLILTLVEKGILVRKRQDYREKIKSNEEFISFLKRDKTALNLAGAALLMNGAGNDIESMILEAYQDTFKDRKEFHSLLENNRQEIYDLAREGLTNLGTYLGDFSLEERAIIPVLLGQVLSGISGDRLTISLEERIVKILRNEYGPAFNVNPEETLSRLEKTINQYEGKVKGIYQRLYNHYSETMKLMGELE